jgi:hypothetical protein
MNILNGIMEWEDGNMTQEEEITFFKSLYETGTLFSLQGMYQRRYMELKDSGLL